MTLRSQKVLPQKVVCNLRHLRLYNLYKLHTQQQRPSLHSAVVLSGDTVPPLYGVLDSTAALSRFLEECEVQSLSIICEYLQDSIENPEIREMTAEIVRTTLWQTTQILQALEQILEEVSREPRS